MGFDPVLAERRFGFGLSSSVPAPQSVADMLAGLVDEDRAQAAFPISSYREFQDDYVLRRRFNTYARENPDTDEGREALEKARDIQRQVRADRAQAFVQWQARRITTTRAFRERLVSFWADHFTARGKGGLLREATPFYVEEAVRPYVSGRFGDLLISCVTHPVMLHYLDQNTSVGPNSVIAQRRQRPLGLNENLAREVLELHTLGVNGPYDQTDVRELAELFTGLAATRDYGFKFRRRLSEPGAETVLGKTYSDKASLATIKEALQDLALHPATAAHVARKLAVHFVSDTPPEPLVSHVTAAYRQSDGDLMQCYQAMLEHPAAWDATAQNIRPPDEFVSATLRALGVPTATMQTLETPVLRDVFFRPLRLMGQPWLAPAGPDGFAEEDEAWATPQGISARLEWGMQAPARLLDALPDPRKFASAALGPDVPERVAFAAKAAETRKVAIGLILASPAFQRR